ncbi:hypothetical protein BDV06DRAFT_218502 [Aspergillus oleicola]
MPAKNFPDPNIMFLYLCIKHSDAKINFEAVSAAMGLKVPAARMRFTRLKEKLESGMSDEDRAKESGGAEVDEGDAGASSVAATPSPTKKRKTAKERTVKAKGKGKGSGKGAQGDDEDVEGGGEGEFRFAKEESDEV